jgi:hypothetical protein
MAGAAIKKAFRSERYEELVDWMEANKGVFWEGGKWTEAVGAGTGSPALVVSSFVPFRVEGDFDFGRPTPWRRTQRPCSGRPLPRGLGRRARAGERRAVR